MCLPVTPFKIEKEWKHAGLKCAVVQAREAMHRCGYVRVPPSHPLHGKGNADVHVHGGLTFAQVEPCEESDGKGWWFGFDCCHLGDAMLDPNPNLATLSEEAKQFLLLMNLMNRSVEKQRDHYWTQAEVERECESLARQLAEMN